VLIACQQGDIEYLSSQSSDLLRYPDLLPCSCKYEQLPVVEYLITSGVSVHQPDSMGDTALKVCLANGARSKQIIECLLQHSARPYVDGVHIFQYCYQIGNFVGLSALMKLGMGAEFPKINQAIFEESKKNCPMRVMLLGSPAAGKTTLVHLIARHFGESGKKPFSTEVATDGICVTRVGNFSFWDFGGQEILCTTHQFFLSDETA
jgi:hypothetical protein